MLSFDVAACSAQGCLICDYHGPAGRCDVCKQGYTLDSNNKCIGQQCFTLHSINMRDFKQCFAHHSINMHDFKQCFTLCSINMCICITYVSNALHFTVLIRLTLSHALHFAVLLI